MHSSLIWQCCVTILERLDVVALQMTPHHFSRQACAAPCHKQAQFHSNVETAAAAAAKSFSFTLSLSATASQPHCSMSASNSYLPDPSPPSGSQQAPRPAASKMGSYQMFVIAFASVCSLMGLMSASQSMKYLGLWSSVGADYSGIEISAYGTQSVVPASKLKSGPPPLHAHVERINKGINEQYSHYKASAVGEAVMDVTRNVHRIEDLKEASSDLITQDLLKYQHIPPVNTADQEPLNIMLFYADDWTMKAIGSLNKYVKTPNIDEMAKNGVLFDQNCVTTSICWMSRATLVTGQYTARHQHTLPHVDNLFNKSVQWPDTLFYQLKQNGYYTGLVGKWHAPGPEEFIPSAFDVFNIYYGDHWMERGGRRRHVTDLNGEDAMKFLYNRPKDKPFALKVAFFATHAIDYHYPSYEPMNETMVLYEDGDIPEVATNTPEYWSMLPWFFNEERNEARGRWKKRYDTPEEYQKSMKTMFAMVSEVDAVVGTVMAQLKAQRILDKTLVIFTTDNGNLHGGEFVIRW
jgi:Sulfatase